MTKYQTPAGGTYYEYDFYAPDDGTYYFFTLLNNSTTGDGYIKVTTDTGATTANDDGLNTTLNSMGIDITNETDLKATNACVSRPMQVDEHVVVRVYLYNNATINKPIPFRITKDIITSSDISEYYIGGGDSGGGGDVSGVDVDFSGLYGQYNSQECGISILYPAIVDSDQIARINLYDIYSHIPEFDDFEGGNMVMVTTTTYATYQDEDYQLLANNEEAAQAVYDQWDDIGGGYDSMIAFSTSEIGNGDNVLELYDERGNFNNWNGSNRWIGSRIPLLFNSFSDSQDQARAMVGCFYPILDEESQIASMYYDTNGFIINLIDGLEQNFSLYAHRIRLHIIDALTYNTLQISDNVLIEYDSYININGIDVRNFMDSDGWIDINTTDNAGRYYFNISGCINRSEIPNTLYIEFGY